MEKRTYLFPGGHDPVVHAHLDMYKGLSHTTYKMHYFV